MGENLCAAVLYEMGELQLARESSVLSVIQLFRSIALINLVLLSDVKRSAVHLHGTVINLHINGKRAQPVQCKLGTGID